MTHPGMTPVVATRDERAPAYYDVAVCFHHAGDWVLLVYGRAAGRHALRAPDRRGRCPAAGLTPGRGSACPSTSRPPPRCPRRSAALAVVGPALRWRHARTATQLVLLLVAVVDRRRTDSSGRSSRREPRHGADVDPLPRPADRRAAGRRQRLLRRLPDDPGRATWRAGSAAAAPLAALAARQVARRCRCSSLVLFAYELFDLWALPAATAWLVVGYFAAALVVDLTFKGASFCKHVCPVGQFNFIASTLSPLEIRSRDRASAQLHDGRLHQGPPRRDRSPAAIVQRGCELGSVPADEGRQSRLHLLPRLRAGLSARQRRLGFASARRGAGRRSAAVGHRPAVAAGRPGGAGAGLHVRRAAQRVRDDSAGLRASRAGSRARSGRTSEAPVLGVLFVLGLGRRAARRCCGGAAWLTRAVALVGDERLQAIVVRYAYALVPFGVRRLARALRLSIS